MNITSSLLYLIENIQTDVKIQFREQYKRVNLLSLSKQVNSDD